jgi:large subunit ribosomal protein L30e
MAFDIAKSLRTAIKDGKVLIGAKKTLDSIQNGDARLIVLASNCPQKFQRAITARSVLTVSLEMNSVELGAVCGKPFTISALSIVDPGSSDIMIITEKETNNERS